MPGAIKVIKTRMAVYSRITVLERSATSHTASVDSPSVIANHRKIGDDCNLCRSIGNRAKAWMEKSISAKTETSVVRRDAKTTDAETAAFMDNTEESPSCVSFDPVAV